METHLTIPHKSRSFNLDWELFAVITKTKLAVLPLVYAILALCLESGTSSDTVHGVVPDLIYCCKRL